MTATDERQTLADFAETAGWHRRNVERTDYYAKGGTRVQVLWQGTDSDQRRLALPRRHAHRVHAGSRHGPGLAADADQLSAAFASARLSAASTSRVLVAR